jgi:hypothetical protein
MPGEGPQRVVIFHDQPAGFADIAAQVAQGVGWVPEQFEAIDPALHRVVVGHVGALVASLGTPRAGIPRSREYPAQPLLSQAHHMRIPIALVSESRDVQRFVNLDQSDIIIPENPPTRIAPVLRAWFTALTGTR